MTQPTQPTQPLAPWATEAHALLEVPCWQACIGLGGNQGDVLAGMVAALSAVHTLPGTRVVSVSSVYETAPVDASGPNYLNAVAVLATSLGPHELLRALQALELAHGRERPYRNAPRTLDLDLLCHGDALLNTPTLTLPHPRMGERAFVLLPLREALSGLPASPTVAGVCLPALPGDAEEAKMARAQGIARQCGFPVNFGI